MELTALVLLILSSLIGFAAVFFTTFGTLLILAGAVLHGALTGFSVFSVKALLVLLTLYLFGEVLEYVLIVAGAKRFGASNVAAAGAVIGGIAGALLGLTMFGIGVLLGTFLGIFLGAFLAELLLQRGLVKSLKAGLGGILGRIISVGAKLIVAVLMLSVIVSRMVLTGI